MEKIILDASIAVTVDIEGIQYPEKVEITFNAEADWTGDYELAIYNSPAKNSVVKPENALVVMAMVMTWIIEPAVLGLNASCYYYEITNTTAKRILYKGKLNITK